MFSFVLLKWASGKDIGKLSILDMGCVRGSDRVMFSDDGMPRSTDLVVVEWRAGKKEPKNGWPVFNARILRASGNVRLFGLELSVSMIFFYITLY